MRQMTLQERFDNWNDEVRIDAENRMVLNVALAGPVSRNGYRYTDDALASATELYANKPVFLDHATQRQRPHDRSTRDLVGSIQNPRFIGGRIRGDIRVLETESGNLFLKLVEAGPPGVGMSHVVVAARSADGSTVEEIRDVISVDAVIHPATTTTFSESSQEPEAADTVTALKRECEQLQTELEALRRECQQLRTRESVRQMLAASGLPAEAITECFERQLIQAESAAVRQQLIQDRASLISGRPRERPKAISLSRSRSVSPDRTDDEFLRVLRRR